MVVCIYIMFMLSCQEGHAGSVTSLRQNYLVLAGIPVNVGCRV